MVRQAAGVLIPLAGLFRIHRQSICVTPVIRKERNTSRINDGMFVSGNAQRTAIHSLTSPAPIQPLDQNETSRKQINHKLNEPGKWAIMPARINGTVHQFGMRRDRRSYRATASK